MVAQAPTWEYLVGMYPVVLLTDFGLQDHYVGVLHAVLRHAAPGVERIDLGHQVPPGDVWQACYLLRCAWPHLPAEAVVLAVVDPGVGTKRPAVAARVGSRFVVAPDNGLVDAVGPADEAVHIDTRRMALPEPSNTFHGRDLFAPAAARLARGEAMASLGEEAEVRSLARHPLPEPRQTSDGWLATIWHVDRFGNLVTNLPADVATSSAVADLGGGAATRRVATFAQGARGEVVVVEGSSGLLELVVNGGSAAESTGLGRGDVLQIRD
jgi:S-adenosylmethionine hydrolase